mgnify:CR=1 FL=1
MNDDQKTSLKDIANSSKTSVKKIVNDIYTKEFSWGDLLQRTLIFLLFFWLVGYVVFGENGIGVMLSNDWSTDCLIGSTKAHTDNIFEHFFCF